MRKRKTWAQVNMAAQGAAGKHHGLGHTTLASAQQQGGRQSGVPLHCLCRWSPALCPHTVHCGRDLPQEVLPTPSLPGMGAHTSSLEAGVNNLGCILGSEIALYFFLLLERTPHHIPSNR